MNPRPLQNFVTLELSEYKSISVSPFKGNTLQDISQFCLDSNKAQYKAIESLIEENPKVRREIK